MLHLFRRKKEWFRWVLIFGIVAIGVTTLLLFVRTPTGMRSGTGAQEVAVVAGRPVTAAEFGRYYRRLYDTYRDVYKLDRQDPKIVKQLGIGQQALNQLIRQYAAQAAAEEMGLKISSEELIFQIGKLFQENNQFIGPERYKEVLRANNLTVKEFEDSMRRDLLAEKFRDVLTDGVIATPEEVRQQFVATNQEVAVRYVVFDPAALKQEVTDEALQKFYDENKESFRESEMRKISYVNVFIPPTEVKVTEEQIQAELPTTAAEEQVHARHILIRVNSPEEEPAAKKKAEELVKQLRAGADFAQLARANSDDAASAQTGGDLGFFGRGQMVPEFEQVAFGQAVNQISDPVKTAFGYHIIQTLEKSGGDDAAKRPLAEFNARMKESEARSRALADQLAAEVRGGKSLEDAAKGLSLEVVQSPLFTEADGLPGSGLLRDQINAAFTMTKGEVSNWVVSPSPESRPRFFVARLDDIVASRLPELAEIRAKVEERMKSEQGNQTARDQAMAFFKAAEKAASFDVEARAKGLAVTTTKPFRKGSTIDDTLKFSPELHDQAFTLPVGGVSTPILIAGKYVVAQVAEKSSIDEAQFAREKDQLAQQLADRKRNEFFGAYLQSLIDDLRRQDKIVINQALFDSLTS